MEPDTPSNETTSDCTSGLSLASVQRIGNLSIKLEGRVTKGGVTTYAIRVSGPQGSHVVHRRYNEFAQLHRDMFGEQVQVNESQAAAMPPKSFFRKMFSKRFRARREDGLSDVASAALTAASDSDLESCPPALRRFLALDGLGVLNESRSDDASSPRAEAVVVHRPSNPDEYSVSEEHKMSWSSASSESLVRSRDSGVSSKQEQLTFWQRAGHRMRKALSPHRESKSPHTRLPHTLSRHHSRQVSRSRSLRSSNHGGGGMQSSSSKIKIKRNRSSLGSSWDCDRQHGLNDLGEPLLQDSFASDLEQAFLEEGEEEEEVEADKEEEQLDAESGLVGSWMDVSVTKNYAETFSISQHEGYFELTERAHDGKVHRARFQRKDHGDEWLTATSEVRSIRTNSRELELGPTSDLVKLEFEFKSHDSEVWTESKAGKVFSNTTDVNISKILCSLSKTIAMLIVLFLALVDAGLFMLTDPDKRSRFLYDYRWHPVQTSTGACLMPPPQPFYLEAGGAMVRTFAISTMLSIKSVMSWSDEYPRAGNQLDSVKARGLRWYLNYQTASLPLSLCMVLYHWKKAASEDFVCLGAMFINAPYILNALVSCAQYAIGRQYVRHMHAWSRGAKHRIQRWRVGKGGFMEGRQRWLRVLSLTSMVLVGTPTMIIFLCYCLHGLLQPILLAQFLIILSSGVTISWLLGAVEFWQLATGEAATGELLKRTQFLSLRWEVLALNSSYANKEQLIEATNVSSHLATALAKQEEIARFGWTYAVFYFMPVFVSVRVALEVLFCEITYMHAGLSAWEATEVTWSERRLNIFVVSLVLTSHMIIWRSWSSLQLLLEWL